MFKKSILLLCSITWVLIAQGQSSALATETISENAQEITYKIIDGDTLKLAIRYPNNFKKRKKYPTIIFFFGGGWNGGSTAQFENQAKYFTDRGMISVLADYRVKSRQGTTPFDAVRDAKSAMRYLRANAKALQIHPKKLVASGGSAGGHLAAATTTLSGLNELGEDLSVSTKANALVLFNPVIDNSPGDYGYDRVGNRYLEISPIHNIKKDTPPTIFFLGSNDALIPVATAEKYKEKMEALGNRCDVHIYEGQTHGFFNKQKDSDEYYVKTVHQADLFLQSIGFLKGEAKL